MVDIRASQGTGVFRVSSSRVRLPDHAEKDLGVYLTEKSINARTGPLFATIKRNSEFAPGQTKMPWPTFVLGTGCLTSSRTVENPLVEGRLRALEAAAGLRTHEEPTLALGELAKQWIAAFRRERGLEPSPDAKPMHTKDTELTLDVILAAVLAAKVVAAAGLEFVSAFTPSTSDGARFDPRSGRWAAADYYYVQPLRRVLVSLMARPGDSQSHVSMMAVAANVLNSLDTSAIYPTDADLLGAYAWQRLTLDDDTYPGWNELLVRQAFLTESVLSRERPRPRLIEQRVEQDSMIARRLLLPTKASWQERLDERLSDRHVFYDEVAATLRQQAEQIRPTDTSKAAEAPPTASAFVSSLDLELEMALFHRRTSFYMVVPVLSLRAYRPGRRNAAFQWIWTRIDPPDPSEPLNADSLASMRRPALWQRVYNHQKRRSVFTQELRAASLPVVVRLAGSPLMDLDHAGDAVEAGDTAAHAVLLDEYSAYNMSLLDIRADEDFRNDVIARPQGDFIRRYWVMVGTQLGDPAVRLRLLAREMASAAEGGDSGDEGTAWRAGITVNTRVAANDADVLDWYQIDSVKGQHRDLTPYLKQFRDDFAATFRTGHPDS